MEILHMLSGPLIGAVIGYFTNYIAVKMLFFPRAEHRMFGKRLPFTPGIIPRRKDALADAVGATIERKLFTPDALCAMLASGEVENAVAAAAANALFEEESTVGALGAILPDAHDARERLETIAADRVCAALCRVDLAAPIAREGKQLVREKLGALGAMFVTDELMASLAQSAQERIRVYLGEHSDQIRSALHDELDGVLAMSFSDAGAALGVSAQDMFLQLRALYRHLIAAFAPALCERLPVAREIACRIRAMSARELETLVLSVMKRELNAIVNLGALVGFVLGLLNLFFR